MSPRHEVLVLALLARGGRGGTADLRADSLAETARLATTGAARLSTWRTALGASSSQAALHLVTRVTSRTPPKVTTGTCSG